MAVPDFQSLMRPLLVSLADGQEHSNQDIREALTKHFELTQEDLDEKIPSGRAKTFLNRTGWATTYLYRTKLIDRPKRSTYTITGRGLKVLDENPELVNLKVLQQFEEFEEFRSKGVGASPQTAAEPVADSDQTPEEQIEAASRALRSVLAADVLDRVYEKSPDFFEQLVLDVLHAMGYGGSNDDSVQKLGKSGDEGVDGVIREDELGLDLIYVQAKRWKNPVGRPEIQKFFGALHGKRATKGVFITTSTYSSEAINYAENVTPRVILIDGPMLARLMINYDVGVTVARSYKIKRIDLDYFASDEDADTVGQPEPAGVQVVESGVSESVVVEGT